MAETHCHPLLVDLEENNVAKVKIKLMKYFQSRKSNGGDCVVEHESGSRTALLRFLKEEDRQHVLEKQTHQIAVGQEVLKMTVRLPTQEKTQQEAPSNKDDKQLDVAATNKQLTTGTTAEVLTGANSSVDGGADEELCSSSTVIGNIPETVNKEFLQMLVENIIKSWDCPSDSQSFILEPVPDISSAVVTFKTGKENADFMTRCPQNKAFIRKGLTIRSLENTQQVVAEGIGNPKEDILRLYFEGEAVDVDDIKINEEEQSAVITFKDHQDVKKVMHKKHRIQQQEIAVYPFYESLGLALYGNDMPSLKLPAAVSEPIDDALWKYLTERKSAAETIHSNLAKHFCNVNFSQPAVHLSPLPSLLQQNNAKALINHWSNTVKSAFAQALSQFRCLKFSSEADIWEECEMKTRESLLSEEVLLVPDKPKGVLTVVGLMTDVNRLEKSLSELIGMIDKRFKREKSIVTEVVKVSPSVFHILCQDGLQDMLLPVYPELKMSYGKESTDLRLTGLNEEIIAANKAIFNGLISLKRQHLDDFMLQLLKDEDQEELTGALFTSHKINAAFEMSAHKVQLLAVSDRDLKEAQDHLERLLTSEYIDVEDSNVLEMPEFLDLVSQLEKANTKPCRTQIHVKGQVVVSGHIDCVSKVSRELDEFITQNTQIEEVVVVKTQAILDYIKNVNTYWTKQLGDKVVVSYRKEAICLSGSRADVPACKIVVEDALSLVCFDSLVVSKPGVKKLFKERESLYVPLLRNETNCLVQLVDETSGIQDSPNQPQVPKPSYQLQTPDGVEIAVCKADMCSYPVDAVVNSSNIDLKHTGGLAGALLKAAGPRLQDECDKIIKRNGPLKPGNCVITVAGGQLCCKYVIHAVAPKFEPAKPNKALAQLKRAVKESLGIAESNCCNSVALPAISSSTLGFPLPLCAVTIVKAVKEYCDERCDDNTLKRIHFVNNDDNTVQGMEAAVIQEFGNHGAGNFQDTNSLLQGTKSPLKKPALPDYYLLHVQTKEGLGIRLRKGLIETSKTEVTVNAVFEDLALNKGAISSAILLVAGSKLQQMVNAKKSSGKVGEIIVTEGCRLRSKHVFHAVIPHWDKGQGASEKALGGIFKDCLNIADDAGFTSIALPAIGTGNLGFPRDLVASLIFNEILAFSSKKQPQHLKKVVVTLFPQDPLTIQVFCDTFKKKFPNASGISVTAGSPPSAAGPFSKVASSSGLHETTMGNVTVQVVSGDITKETTDIIVNSSNDNFTLKSGVSKAILDAAGPTVEAECKNLGANPNPGMVMTQPGNLKCKKILHLSGKTNILEINKVVKDALQMCLTNSYTSVSFPALGTGQGSVQAKQVADAMMDAVIDVLGKNASSTLTKVRIVIFQVPMLKDFYNSMQEREVPDPTNKGFWGNISSKIKGLFVADTSPKPQKDKDFVINPVKVDPACFHICGDSVPSIDSAKKWINDQIAKEQYSITLSDVALLGLSDADCQKIVNIQKTMSVTIRTESKQQQTSITIEGLSKDVLEASKEIHKMLRNVRDAEELKGKVKLASTVAEWQYKQGQLFQSFDEMSNFNLEQALEKNLQTTKVTIGGRDYSVTMPSGPATDSQGQTLDIKRIDKLKGEDLPEHWDPIPPNTTTLALTIKPGSTEHTEILNLFQASCQRTVIKIERIQNPVLWKGLQIHKRAMDLKNGHKNNERRLFHGTCGTTVNTINERGFNRSYAGKNAAFYGNGTYFAVKASYSAQDTYSKPNQNGEKFMYVCRVLTGDYTLGKQHMIVPPAKSNSSVDTYDSVVDNLTNPSMFIIFHDTYACPEYLITFK